MAGRCFKCSSGNCAVMGYHATLPTFISSNSSENEIIPETSDVSQPQPGKYFLSTGRDFPFCRKFFRFFLWSKKINKFQKSLRTTLSLHHWLGKTKNRWTLGPRLFDSCYILGSRSTAEHWSNTERYPIGAWNNISSCYYKSTWSGRSDQESRIELGSRNECAWTAIVMSVLV